MNHRRRAWCVPALEQRGWVLIVCALALTCGLALAWQLRFFSDDGAILWRYADHLSQGHGLRYNIEEAPIEGTSNIPFTVLLAALFRCGFDAETAALILSFAIAPLAWIWVWIVARRAGLPGWAAAATWLALAGHHSWLAWTTSGLDMRFATWLTLIAIARVLREECERQRHRVWSGVALGLLAIARPEGFLFFGLVLAWRVWASERRVKLWSFVGGFAAVKLAQLLFQLIYFQDWLPNTAHAKVTGLWLEPGLIWIFCFGGTYLLPLSLACACYGALQPRRRSEPLRFLLWVIIGYLGAIVGIGGERFGFRLADPVVPLIYVATAGGVALGVERLLHRRADRLLLGRMLGCAAIFLPAASGFLVRELPWFRSSSIERVEFTGTFYERQKQLGLLMHEHFDAQTRVGIGAAGAMPYFSKFYVLDLLGLNDREIARRPADPGRPLWHQKHANEADHERARLDLLEPRLYERHPVHELAQLYGIDVAALLQGAALDADAMPQSLAALFSPEQMPHTFCVRLGPDQYVIATTRQDAEIYRARFRARGIPVLF